MSSDSSTGRPRQMTLVAFMQAQNCTNLPSSWRHAAAMPDFMTAEYYMRIARTLEDGRFHIAFFDDRLAMPDRYGEDHAESVRHGVRVVKMDLFPLMTAMGLATRHLGIAGTCSTTARWTVVRCTRRGTGAPAEVTVETDGRRPGVSAPGLLSRGPPFRSPTHGGQDRRSDRQLSGLAVDASPSRGVGARSSQASWAASQVSSSTPGGAWSGAAPGAGAPDGGAPACPPPAGGSGIDTPFSSRQLW